MLNSLLKLARQSVLTPWHRLLNLVDAPVVVLLYHRVTALASDPEMLAVSPTNFRDQMQYLKKNFSLVRFEADWSGITEPSVAITFDDGYADNVLEALPILEELRVPATFFVATGTIGTRTEFWWNELERLILAAPELPARFSLDDGPSAKSWALAELSRLQFYQEMVQALVACAPARRDELLARLRKWAGCTMGSSDLHRAMTIGELKQLAASDVATIGAHTVSHAQLSALTAAAQREEIERSKEQLGTWTGKDISVFSYPFGKRSQYTKESARLCREASFAKAAANFPGQAHRWTDPYQIPRHLVRDWPLEQFTTKLKEFWTR